MTTSVAGLAFIRSQEGLSLTVKGDTGGKQQIGFGHDLANGEFYPDGITEAEAEALLGKDVATVDATMARYTALAALTQAQWDALADFTYECGGGALHTLLSHGVDHVPEQLPRWVYANVEGVETKLAGMVNRRAAEVRLWLTGQYNSQ